MVSRPLNNVDLQFIQGEWNLPTLLLSAHQYSRPVGNIYLSQQDTLHLFIIMYSCSFGQTNVIQVNYFIDNQACAVCEFLSE
jgi:hypothetical protein